MNLRRMLSLLLGLSLPLPIHAEDGGASSSGTDAAVVAAVTAGSPSESPSRRPRAWPDGVVTTVNGPALRLSRPLSTGETEVPLETFARHLTQMLLRPATFPAGDVVTVTAALFNAFQLLDMRDDPRTSGLFRELTPLASEPALDDLVRSPTLRKDFETIVVLLRTLAAYRRAGGPSEWAESLVAARTLGLVKTTREYRPLMARSYPDDDDVLAALARVRAVGGADPAWDRFVSLARERLNPALASEFQRRVESVEVRAAAIGAASATLIALVVVYILERWLGDNRSAAIAAAMALPLGLVLGGGLAFAGARLRRSKRLARLRAETDRFVDGCARRLAR